MEASTATAGREDMLEEEFSALERALESKRGRDVTRLVQLRAGEDMTLVSTTAV